jgi:hypothetical protein
MNDQVVELNLGKVLMAILKRYDTIELSPESLLEDVDDDYQLRVDFNEETAMFEISLEESNES